MALFIAALLLEVCLFLLLVSGSLWRLYPFFFTYVIWILASNSALFLAYLVFTPFYSNWYWQLDNLDVFVRLLVIWEVFRETFPRGKAPYRSLSKAWATMVFVLLACAFVTFGSFQNYGSVRSARLAVDRNFGSTEAAMLLGALLIAHFRGTHYGRNVRWIASAFGVWLSITIATSAMVELTSSFPPYWYYLRPLSFLAMVAAWILALWVHEPNPSINKLVPQG